MDVLIKLAVAYLIIGFIFSMFSLLSIMLAIKTMDSSLSALKIVENIYRFCYKTKLSFNTVVALLVIRYFLEWPYYALEVVKGALNKINDGGN